ncbi:MAG: peptide chain release factor 1, partial [Planktotalea sp.]
MVPMDRLMQITQRFEFLEAKMSSGADGSEIAELARE